MLDHRIKVVHQRFPLVCICLVLFVLIDQLCHVFAKFVLEDDVDLGGRDGGSLSDFGHEGVGAVWHLTGHTLNFAPIERVHFTSVLAQSAFEKLDFAFLNRSLETKNVFLFDRDLQEAQISQVRVRVYNAT